MGAAARKRGDRNIARQIGVNPDVDYQLGCANLQDRNAQLQAQLTEARACIERLRIYRAADSETLAEVRAELESERSLCKRWRNATTDSRAAHARCSQLVRDCLTPEQVQAWREDNPK